MAVVKSDGMKSNEAPRTPVPETKVEEAVERYSSGEYWVTLMDDAAKGEPFDPEHNPEDAARKRRLVEALKGDTP